MALLADVAPLSLTRCRPEGKLCACRSGTYLPTYDLKDRSVTQVARISDTYVGINIGAF